MEISALRSFLHPPCLYLKAMSKNENSSMPIYGIKMTVLDIDVTTTATLIRITVNRVHDRGNTRRYVFRRDAMIGFDMEGEGTNHTYIVIYMHGRNIRFELPKDASKQMIIFTALESILRNWS
jgi:hypothetical protein